jgi:hypothetical protein
MMMRRRLVTLPLALLLPVAAVAAACNTDPVHQSAVDALGAEAPSIPSGQFHRAGQPCVTCHGDEGPAKQQFTLAGTVFYGPSSNNGAAPVGAEGVTVVFQDDTTSTFQVQTNCAGNFFVKPEDWPGHPQFPVLVRIGGTPVGNPAGALAHYDVAMQSHIGRTGSCGDCHLLNDLPNDYDTPGLIRLSPTDNPSFTGDTQNCQPIPAQYGKGL